MLAAWMRMGCGGRAPERLPWHQLAGPAVFGRSGGDVGPVLGDGAGELIQGLQDQAPYGLRSLAWNGRG